MTLDLASCSKLVLKLLLLKLLIMMDDVGSLCAVQQYMASACSLKSMLSVVTTNGLLLLKVSGESWVSVCMRW